jgi:hypothetical protein
VRDVTPAGFFISPRATASQSATRRFFFIAQARRGRPPQLI